eukprot:TRINITY_DN110336_c0_g1_i1.p1 TRINITY_DN110336_c0_g1~~TRINITY_DN110336_c0_g1_i1.p1  ORF type:complete len:198 (-),score=37.69 TRINITY_DN110336_c0_g1_i1:79-672(-)
MARIARVASLSGESCTVKLPATARVAELQRSVETKLGIRLAEQQLTLGTSLLSSGDLLGEVLPADGQADISLTVVPKQYADMANGLREGDERTLMMDTREDVWSNEYVVRLALLMGDGHGPTDMLLDMVAWHCPSLLADKDLVMALARCNGQVLKWADKGLRSDREVVEAAVRQDRSALRHASLELQEDTYLPYCVY